MRGQLYRGRANATALFSSSVVSALGCESDDPGSNPGPDKALCPWDVRGKKMQAPLLRLAKSIYYISSFSGVRVTPKSRNKASVVPQREWSWGVLTHCTQKWDSTICAHLISHIHRKVKSEVKIILLSIIFLEVQCVKHVSSQLPQVNYFILQYMSLIILGHLHNNTKIELFVPQTKLNFARFVSLTNT